MKIAIIAAEMAPHAKAGGLADVIGALPSALKAAGAEVSVVLPGYQGLLSSAGAEPVATDCTIAFGAKSESFNVLRAQSAAGVPLFLIDHPGFFARPGLYGDDGADYPDNLQRYIFFGRAAAHAIARQLQPDVVHAHDWHTAMASIAIRADHTVRDHFARAISVFTIHNLAFQGICEPADFPLLNLDWSYFSMDCLEFFGRINLMKGAVVLSDGASTVSPSYAHEVASDPALGFGLEGVLRARGDHFTGILNGADYDEWNPATDPHIAANYTRGRPAGKNRCIRDLRDHLKLPELERTPLIGMVSRMTSQKGIDLLVGSLDALLELGVQLVILGAGDPAIEKQFRDAQTRHPDRLRAVIGFDNALAHRIQAGSDIFLMPSRFEPCGLTQMYAMEYGTVPVVRATGGLKDTVTEFDPAPGAGVGFVFTDYRPDALLGALQRAIAAYHNRQQWQRLMRNCFAADFSWDRAAREYLSWFERLRAERVSAAA